MSRSTGPTICSHISYHTKRGLPCNGTNRLATRNWLKPLDFCVFWVWMGCLETGRWRSGRDSNPRYAFGVYSLSRRAPSTTRPPLRMPGRQRPSVRGAAAQGGVIAVRSAQHLDLGPGVGFAQSAEHRGQVAEPVPAGDNGPGIAPGPSSRHSDQRQSRQRLNKAPAPDAGSWRSTSPRGIDHQPIVSKPLSRFIAQSLPDREDGLDCRNERGRVPQWPAAAGNARHGRSAVRSRGDRDVHARRQRCLRHRHRSNMCRACGSTPCSRTSGSIPASRPTARWSTVARSSRRAASCCIRPTGPARALPRSRRSARSPPRSTYCARSPMAAGRTAGSWRWVMPAGVQASSTARCVGTAGSRRRGAARSCSEPRPAGAGAPLGRPRGSSRRTSPMSPAGLSAAWLSMPGADFAD